SSSLETIGQYAFSHCESLESIELPPTLKTIEWCAFCDCKSLKSIVIPESIENIGKIPFTGCSSLKNVTLPSTLKTIPEQMFQSCAGLEEFNIPDTVTEIAADAFDNCENLKSVTIPDSVTKIGDYAFASCKNLETIAIPPSVKSIGKGAFYQCESLQSVKFIKKVTFTKEKDSEDPSNFKSVVHEDPSQLKSIEDSTFLECKNLESINIPPEVQKIGKEAFRGCSSLKMVILPNSVSKIGTEAFINCTDLRSLIIMNKACVVGEGADDYNGRTICNEFDQKEKKAVYTGTINGFEDSTAVKYANDNGYDFEKINFWWRTNNWAFTNSKMHFEDKYFINTDSSYKSNDIGKMLEGLSNTEFERIRTNLIENDWHGSCYGMACTSILSCYGILKPYIGDGYTSIYDCSSKNNTPISDILKTLINYYHALQTTDYITQLHVYETIGKTEKEKLYKLIDCLRDDSPVLLSYLWMKDNDQNNILGHTVVAYGLENGPILQNGKVYDFKVLIYDPNNTEFKDDYCIYFNIDGNNVSWAIPGYMIDSDIKVESLDNSGKEDTCRIAFVTDDIELINYHGNVNNSACIREFQFFFPILQSKDMFFIDKHKIKTGSYINRIWNTIATADDYIEISSTNITGETDGNIALAMSDPDTGYIVTLEKPEQLGFMLSYENTLLQAEASNGSEAKFDPSGCVAVSGENTDYELEIVLNDGYMVNDWYDLTVEGSGVNDATLEKSENGYILNATNLKDVYIKAESDEAVKSCVFSTDYPEVFIFEKDGNTIGAAIDTDNNGTYETEIEIKEAEYESLKLETTTDVSSNEITTSTTTTKPTTTTPITSTSIYTLGDVTGDGIIDGRDATDVLTEYAKTSTGQDSKYTEEQKKAADANKDGIIDGRDATLILTYYAKTSVGETMTIEEYIESSKQA
ncbi:MAG TPA: leucine-rich repeat protein, partial [Ruminococcus flavefaciens]|nr:leucine-rich repeat protein [Ruminococcus flavefaciens]